MPLFKIAGTTEMPSKRPPRRGIPVVFVDTAGLRHTGDEIEQEGIRRSHDALQNAELILHILDASVELTEEDRRHLDDLSSEKRIIICNKIDLEQRLRLGESAIPVSCTTGDGIEALKDAIKARAWS